MKIPRNTGVWLPEAVFKALWTHDLRSSEWRVLLAVVWHQYRFGGKEARITLAGISREIGLSQKTVKRAVAVLRTRGILRRRARGALRLTLGEGDNVVTSTAKIEGASMLAPSRGQHVDPVPTLLFFIDKMSMGCGGVGEEIKPFTQRQAKLLHDVFRDARELLCGADPLDQPVGPAGGQTFAEWATAILESGNKAEAGQFIRSALALRKKLAATGREIPFESARQLH